MSASSRRPAVSDRSSFFDRLGWPDWLLLGCVCTAFVVLCIVRSNHRLLWADELYGYRVLSSPTFSDVLRGWREGADGGGIFYYILGRLWILSFGLSELTLRMFSTAGMCIALILTWACVRRYFDLLPTAVALGIAYTTPPVMLWQEVNGRFYGLFLASVAFASLCFLLTSESPSRSPGVRVLLLTAAAHALLVGSHILGLVYSFSLIVLTLVSGLAHRKVPVRVLLAQAAGWLVLPFSLHAIRASSSIATTTFWTQRPSWTLLAPAFALFGKLTEGLLVSCLILGIAGFIHRRRRVSPGQRSHLLPRPALALVGALLLADLVLFAKSQTGISIYADRYLLPLSIALALILAACLQPLAEVQVFRSVSGARSAALGAMLLLPCLAYAASRDVNAGLYPPASYLAAIEQPLPPHAAVLASNPAFNLLSHYDRSRQYLFMTDWRFDLQPQHAGQDFSGERLMENWVRAGYEPGKILPCPELFTRYDDLYVLVDFHQADWFNQVLARDPHFQVRQITHIAEFWPADLYRVHRLTPGDVPC